MPGSPRDRIAECLHRDLIGPDAENEEIPDRPSDTYLTGVLWPQRTRTTGEEDDRLGAEGADGAETDSGNEQEQVAAAGTMRPAVAGLSFAVASAIENTKPQVIVEVEFGMYRRQEQEDDSIVWKRVQAVHRTEPIQCEGSRTYAVPTAVQGIFLDIRAVPWAEAGASIVTITLVNRIAVSQPTRTNLEEATIFQAGIRIYPCSGTRVVPRPPRTLVTNDDDRSSELLYRNVHEYAVGHTCGADWEMDESGEVRTASTTWMPTAFVSATSADGHTLLQNLRTESANILSADWLSNASDKDLAKELPRLSIAYQAWIDLQREKLQTLEPEQRAIAEKNLSRCTEVCQRLERGSQAIAQNPNLANAFRLANRAMAIQYDWASGRQGVAVSDRQPLLWRPFQLGFILLAAESVINPDSDERLVMDLLWFPTGGGKTEAYLALVAFLAFGRRLLHGDAGAGVAVVMRYTLRLLTLQQFSRAAAVILACEAIRRGKVPISGHTPDLGEQPFSIGLWVGGDATPNDVETAAGLIGVRGGPTPVQIKNCPACNSALVWTVKRRGGRPEAIEVRCLNSSCLLHHGKEPLPVATVDQDIYRIRPTLLIGTVDKFAQITRWNEVARLFAVGSSATPDLVIQDELHLISGPLGTLVALYECAVDMLFQKNSRPPKVIGSTATIRRAPEQVRALYDRSTSQFPPPAIDAADSGFAVVVDDPERARKYIGITTAGRSAKFTLQAVAGSLMQGVQDVLPSDDVRDPYWTLVGYFNALRELGGALVLFQDDVTDSMALFAKRHGAQPRHIGPPQELTSRLSQDQIVDVLQDLQERAPDGNALDSVLATNMLSVGVDIPRLGLMIVNGQPKGIAEYIQATSRVGRRHPGLIVSVLNNAKARDRSHFETFRTWHSTLYKDVEITSVTPFAARARDRALHAPLVALARHLVAGLEEHPRLTGQRRRAVESLADYIAERASRIDPDESDVRAELLSFIDQWERRNPLNWWKAPATSLLVNAEDAVVQGRPVGKGIPRSTMNNMRTVEPGVPFRLAPGLAQH